MKQRENLQVKHYKPLSNPFDDKTTVSADVSQLELGALGALQIAKKKGDLMEMIKNFVQLEPSLSVLPLITSP